MKYADHIEITCQNKEMANTVFAQIDSLKAYCIENEVYTGIPEDKLKMQARVRGSKVCITVSRPDYEGRFDPNFFDGSFESIAAFLEEKVPGAILSGNREYRNPDIFRSMQEELTKENGVFSTLTSIEVDWEEIDQLLQDGADIGEICSMLDMEEDEVFDGLSSLSGD